jgi:transcriptional regulator with XRE-family HTH domain
MKLDRKGEAGDYAEPVRKLCPLVHALRKKRYERGISQNKLAILMGYAPKSVKTWEAGLAQPRLDAFKNWAQTLDLEIKLVKRK